MNKIIYVLLIIFSFYIGYIIKPNTESIIYKDIIINTTDTFINIKPHYINTITIDTIIDTLYTIDSVLVPVYIPITQKHYSDSIYNKSDTAIIDSYVSGYKVNLDSTKVIFKNKIEIPVSVYKNTSNWSIGLSAGYGISKDGFSPIIGISLNYKLFNF